MSYLFDDASTEYLEVASAIVSGHPLTFACWAKPDAAVNSSLVAISDNGVDNQTYMLAARGVADPKAAQFVIRHSGGTVNVLGTVEWSIGSWHHFCAVSATATSHAVYLDGADKQTSATSAEPTGLDTTAVGREPRLTPANYASGRIDHAVIYNVALTDAEVAMLAAGASPLLIRPTGLVAYWMLVGGVLVDVIGGVTLTNNGATVDPDHSPLWYPQASDVWHAATAGAPAVSVALLRRRGRA